MPDAAQPPAADGESTNPAPPQPVNRAWPSDADYLRNGPGGDRFFYPVSHTNPNNYLCWDTIREFDLLRSHAVADAVMADLAEALRPLVDVLPDGEQRESARAALARHANITGENNA